MKKGIIVPTLADAINYIARPGTKAGNNFIDQNLPAINFEIDRLIYAEESNPKQIEQMLDVLSTYDSLGKAEKEFKKLKKYYSKKHPENAKKYDK